MLFIQGLEIIIIKANAWFSGQKRCYTGQKRSALSWQMNSNRERHSLGMECDLRRNIKYFGGLGQ